MKKIIRNLHATDVYYFLISTVIFVTAWILSRLSLHANCDVFQYEKFIFPNKYIKGSILEIGSGRGANLDVLRHIQSVTRLEAVDVVDKSTKTENKPILFDGVNLPFKQGEFDTGIVYFVLHHATDCIALLKNALDVCKVCIVVEDLPHSLLDKLFCYFHIKTSGWSQGNHFYTDMQWKQLFSDHNISVLETKYINRNRYITYPVPRGVYVLTQM